MNSAILCYAVMAGTSKFCCVGGHADDHVTNKRTSKQIVQKICLKSTMAVWGSWIEQPSHSPGSCLSPADEKWSGVTLTSVHKLSEVLEYNCQYVKWTEFIFLASSTIVLWPLLISPSEEHPLPFQQLFCFISWITCCCTTSKPCPSSDLCLTVLKFDSVHFGSWKNSKVG